MNNNLLPISAWPFATNLFSDNVRWSPSAQLQDRDARDEPRITHIIDPSGKGGVTMAWRKMSGTKNARMVEVAVAYCSPNDVFTKKIGKQTALENFEAGMTVLVPARTDKNDDSIPFNLRNMFWHSLGYWS
jgi:hypothetical protein